MKNWKIFKEKLLQNKKVAVEYEKLKPHYQLISQLIEARIKKGLTQGQLAERIGTQQSAIARLESGNSNPSLELLEKVTKAVDSKLLVQVK